MMHNAGSTTSPSAGGARPAMHSGMICGEHREPLTREKMVNGAGPASGTFFGSFIHPPSLYELVCIRVINKRYAFSDTFAV